MKFIRNGTTNTKTPALGNKRIRTITIKQVQSAVNKWFKQVSQNYKRWYHYTTQVFEFALKRGYVVSNPAKLITLPKRQEASGDKDYNFWNKSELQRFFDHIDKDKELERFTLFRMILISLIPPCRLTKPLLKG